MLSGCGHMVHISNDWAVTIGVKLQLWMEMAAIARKERLICCIIFKCYYIFYKENGE